MMKVYSYFASVVLLPLLIGGCISSAPQELDGTTYEVRSNSTALKNTILLKRRNTVLNNNGFIKVQVEALNLTARDIQLQYRFRWMDENKMQIDSAATMWKPVAIGAKSTEFFTSTAPTTQARDFWMEVRFVNTSARW